MRSSAQKTDFVEQSSTDIWQQVTTVKESVALSAIDPIHVKSIGFDATCSLVAVIRTVKGFLFHQAVKLSKISSWMDHRAVQETVTINLTNDPSLRYVGGEVSIEMELPKILWLKNHYPERYENVWRFFDLADFFLVWKATSGDVASTCTLTCKWNYLAHQGQFRRVC